MNEVHAISDRYEIVKPISASDLAEVFVAIDHLMERRVALKIFAPHVTIEDDVVKRLVQDNSLATSLHHDNLVRIYDVGSAPTGRIYVAMEYVDGRDLRSLLNVTGALPLGVAIDIGAQIASGVAFLHDKRIVHRDLKPSNILISDTGHATIADFGIARRIGRDEPILDAIAYIAPEALTQREFSKSSDVYSADVYSVGAIMFEMFTGRSPLEINTAASAFHALRSDEPPFMSDFRSDVPVQVAQIIRRAMEKDPASRPRSFDLAIALGEFRGTLHNASRKADDLVALLEDLSVQMDRAIADARAYRQNLAGHSKWAKRFSTERESS